METAAVATAAPAAKKRRTEAHEGRETLTPPPHEPLPPVEPKGSHGQEPPRGAGGEEEDGVDRISFLPDDILREIVFLLPTKDAARTQTLASQWRGIWLSSPLNLDCNAGGLHRVEHLEADLVSRIIAAHPVPVRRICIPVHHLYDRPATVDAWLRSPTLDNLHELDFDPGIFFRFPKMSLPVSALRCWTTLRVVTVSECRIPESSVEVLRFPQLRQLGLVGVEISKGLLNSMISGSPVLECLLLLRTSGFDSVRINSPSLVRVGFHFTGTMNSVNFIIDDAPSLKSLLNLGNSCCTQVSVISAPKLETFGCLRNDKYEAISSGSRYTFGTTILQDLKLHSFTTKMQSVKILAIDFGHTHEQSLDTVINLIPFFPCVEKRYIQMPDASRGKNLWRHKHRDLVKCLDLNLKTLVLKNYIGIKSQVSFATFFILNAKRLELMRFETLAYRVIPDYDQFIANQHRLLPLQQRASGRLHFQFTKSSCNLRFPHTKHVSDLSKTDPFECGSMCVL